MGRVFNTYELLDLIISQCRLYDLLVRLPRVSRVFNRIIANNKNIQQFLFFTPWGPYDHLHHYGLVNPFIKFMEYKRGEDRGKVDPVLDFGPGPKKTENEDTDDDGDDTDLKGDWPEPGIYHEINWERLKGDKRFMYERASWRRMLAIQPPKREVWNIVRLRGNVSDVQYTRRIGPKGRFLGDIFDAILVQEAVVDCLDTRTFVRTNDRYLAMVAVDVTLRPLDGSEDGLEEEEIIPRVDDVEEEDIAREPIAEKGVPEYDPVEDRIHTNVHWIQPRVHNFIA